MSQSTPHGGLLIKAPGRGRVAAHNRGIGAKCDTRAARGELPDSSGISDVCRGLNKGSRIARAYDCHGVTRCSGAGAEDLQTKGCIECNRQSVSVAHSVRTCLRLVYLRGVAWREIVRCVIAHLRRPLLEDRRPPADRRDDHLRVQGQ